MADTVVTIGGDSSGLQDAFKDAAKKADGLKVETKKLTDQLREVGDEADKAAGAFVQKFGGGGAIKAIAGVGAAVGIAKAGVEAFLDSSEALFRSYGEEGQKAWDDTEKSLFAIKGAFAEAVLGGGSLEDMAGRLKSIFEGTKAIVDGLLTPVRLLAEAFWGNSTASAEAAAKLKVYNSEVAAANASAATMEGKVKSLTEQMWALTGQTTKLTQARQDDFITATRLAIKELEQADYVQDVKIANSQALAAEEGNRARAFSDAVKQHHRLDREGMELANKLFAEYQTKSFNDALERQKTGLSKERAEQKAHLEGLISEVEAYAKEQEALAKKPKASSAPPKAAAGEKPPEDPTIYVLELQDSLQVLTEEQGKAYQETERLAGESISKLIEMKQSEFAEIERLRLANADAEVAIETDKIQRIEAAEAAGHAAGEEAKRASLARQAEELEAFLKREADAYDQAAKQRAAEQAKLLADLYTLTVNNSAKMLAVDLQDKEKSKTAAQRATAAVVQGLGDMAMVKSGLAAAAGNFGEAAAFSAVGTLAYAIAAKMAPSEKTKTTAPAAAMNGPSTTNVSYNLRVDAAFADGESVARRFAEMQRGAQRRGLV